MRWVGIQEIIKNLLDNAFNLIIKKKKKNCHTDLCKDSFLAKRTVSFAKQMLVAVGFHTSDYHNIIEATDTLHVWMI